MNDVNVLEYLKVLLNRDSITYTDIAKKLDTTPQNIAQTFKRSDISVSRLQKIAAAADYELIIDFKKVPRPVGSRSSDSEKN